jgi:hypothetical protein
MSLELLDARIKITPETDAVLEAVHRATGKDRSEIARDVLHTWAENHIAESVLTMQLLKAKGLSGSGGV